MSEGQEVMSSCRLAGFPVTLAQIGLQEPTRELLEPIALRAVQTGESTHNERCEVSSAQLVDAIVRVDERGRSWQL